MADITRERWLELAAKVEAGDNYTPAEIEELLGSGDIKECAGCGQLSAHAWELANAYRDEKGEGGSYYEPKRGLVAHIGTASCWEFECGHCRANNVQADAPILADCYTHAGDR